jgi:hypothetical protein
MERRVDALDEVRQLEDHPLYARLAVGVMILYRVDQLRQAPVRVRLHLVELLL